MSFFTASTVAEIISHLKYFRISVKLAEQEVLARTKKVG